MGMDPAGPGPDAQRTGTRLALALLGYFVLITIIITLSPFDFAVRPAHVTLMVVPGDIVANITLFLPIGFLARSLEASRARPGWRVVALAAGFSLCIEASQIFLSGRYVSAIDIAANTAGAWLGQTARDRVDRWAAWRPDVVGRIGLDIPLVGLLYLLVPQLWLSGVGLVDDPRRSVTTVLLGCAGGIVLIALHRHRWKGGVRLAANVVPPLAALWFLLGALPAFTLFPRVVSALTLALGLTTWLLLRRSGVFDQRRFEVETLRRFVPVFAVYVILAALWPPFRGLVPWHGALGFSDGLNGAGVVELLLLLEQVGGFTLLGYAAAEWRGRQERSLASDLPGVLLKTMAFAAALEVVQGFLAGPGASATRALLASSGAAYGVAVYHLARAHVRALRDEPAPQRTSPRGAGITPPTPAPQPAPPFRKGLSDPDSALS